MVFFQGITYLEEKIKGMINLEKSKGTHWVSLFIERNTAIFWLFWNRIYSTRSIKQSQR